MFERRLLVLLLLALDEPSVVVESGEGDITCEVGCWFGVVVSYVGYSMSGGGQRPTEVCTFRAALIYRIDEQSISLSTSRR